MNLQEIRGIAKAHGIKVGRLNKTTLIRQIQRSEGNYDCFASDAENRCDQQQCLWRADCHKTSRNTQAH